MVAGLQDLQQGSPYCCVNRRGILKDGIPSILAIVLPEKKNNKHGRRRAGREAVQSRRNAGDKLI